MIFYKYVDYLSENIKKYNVEDGLRNKISKNGKLKYFKYFNSTLVSQYILEKTYEIPKKKSYLWAR